MIDVTHKLDIKKFKTLCGLNVIAVYNSMFAMTDEAGKANVKVTFGVPTCKVCKEKDNKWYCINMWYLVDLLY